MNENIKNGIPHISAELIPISFMLIEPEPEPKITYINNKAVSLFKVKDAEEFKAVYKNDCSALINRDDLSTVLYTVKHGLKKHKEHITAKCRVCAADGSRPFVKAHIIPVYDENGKCLNLYAALYDDTESHNLIQKYLKESSCDALTGLLNREGLIREFKTEYQNTHSDFFVIILDIDNFKEENDISGHSFGDIILKSTAELIRSCFDSAALINRHGGDEFVIITRAPEESVKGSLNALLQKIAEIGKKAKNGVRLSASAGVSKSIEDGAGLEILLKNADKALYYSKAHGKGRYTFFKDIKSTGEDSYKNDLMRGTRLTPKNLINNEKSRKLIAVLDSIYLEHKGSEKIKPVLRALIEIYGCRRAYIYKLSEDKIPERRLYSWPLDTLSPYEKICRRDEILKKTYVRCASRFTPEGFYICENLSFISGPEYDFLKSNGTESFVWIIFKTSPDKEFAMLGLDFSENPIRLSTVDFSTILILSKIIGYTIGFGALPKPFSNKRSLKKP